MSLSLLKSSSQRLGSSRCPSRVRFHIPLTLALFVVEETFWKFSHPRCYCCRGFQGEPFNTRTDGGRLRTRYTSFLQAYSSLRATEGSEIDKLRVNVESRGRAGRNPRRQARAANAASRSAALTQNVRKAMKWAMLKTTKSAGTTRARWESKRSAGVSMLSGATDISPSVVLKYRRTTRAQNNKRRLAFSVHSSARVVCCPCALLPGDC